MLRKKITPKETEKITWRGGSPGRIEAFSDSIFAFALTLLIVSLEVPKTFTELKGVFGGLFAFAICFTLLFQVWYHQNLFFRRYGLNDIKTIVLNAALLFTVLFYVYPLKFLFSFFSPNAYMDKMIQANEVPQLMLMYAAGFCSIFIIFAFMYRHANACAEELNLSPEEAFETRTHMYVNIGFVCVGIFAALSAFIIPHSYAAITGALYGLSGPVVSTIHSKRKKIFAAKNL